MLHTDFDGTQLTNSVVYFGALGWCQPCKFLHPMMEEFSKKYPSLDFYYVDVDSAPELAQEYRIQSVPTVKLFINGTQQNEFKGLQAKHTYTSAFDIYSGE